MKVTNIFKKAAVASVITAGMALTANAADNGPDVTGLGEDVNFTASIKLVKPIAVTLDRNLVFPEQVAGQAGPVSVAPNSSTAAVFNAVGEPNRNVIASVVENTITMVKGAGGSTATEIVVGNWQYGGNDSIAPDGSSLFDASGNLNNIRVGATATIEADDEPGDYVGTATFRLVYA